MIRSITWQGSRRTLGSLRASTMHRCVSIPLLCCALVGAASVSEPGTGFALPLGCRNEPTDGIDSQPGTIVCRVPSVMIKYDIFGTPGVTYGDWRAPKVSADVVWQKVVKVDGVPAVYGVRRTGCTAKQQLAFVDLPTAGPAHFEACVRNRSEARFVHDLALKYSPKPLPGTTLTR